MAKSFNLAATERHFKQVLMYAPGMLGNDAVNFFLDSFKRQAWERLHRGRFKDHTEL